MSLVELHKNLVEIDSSESIEEIQEYILQYLESHNETAYIDDHDNIIAEKGDGKPSYILNTHFDTVPPHIKYQKDGDTIYGRGSADAKGPLAVFLYTFVNTTPTDGTLRLTLTPDEESKMSGAFGLDDELLQSATGFIIGEPTNLDVCTSSKGYFEGTIQVTGVAAHSSTPEDGCNAITIASDIIQRLNSFDETVGYEPHDQLGRPILTPTLIEGGEAINQIPESCSISFSRRGIPPETQDSFITQLQNHLEPVIPEEGELSIESEFDEFLQPFDTEADAHLVQVLQQSGAGPVRAFTAATEASAFSQYNVPIVVFGPGYISDEDGAVAHSEREYVSETDLIEANQILQETVQSLVVE